jgi:hypothetical protein
MVVATLLSSTSYDFWRDPIWEAVSVIIALVLGLAGFAFELISYIRKKQYKEISYELISDTPLAIINPSLKSSVEITFGSMPAKDARIVVIKVMNSGSMAVTAEDYFDDIAFEFRESTLIGFGVSKTKPDNLIETSRPETLPIVNGNLLTLPKYDLNNNDYVIFTAISFQRSDIMIKGRIKDGKIIRYDREKSRKKMMRLSMVIAYLGMAFVFIALSPVLIDLPDNIAITPKIIIISIISLLIGIIIMTISLRLVSSINKKDLLETSI